MQKATYLWNSHFVLLSKGIDQFEAADIIGLHNGRKPGEVWSLPDIAQY
jgi:hypothetical protein